MVTSEPMACGVPVVVSSNTGTVARNGIDGPIIPPHDVEALKDKLLYLSVLLQFLRFEEFSRVFPCI